MKIKHKILVVNIFQGLSLLILILILFSFSAYTRAIGEEQNELSTLYNALIEEQVVLERLSSRSLDIYYPLFIESQAKTDELITALSGMKYLPRISESVAESLESMAILKQARKVSYKFILNSVVALLNNIEIKKMDEKTFLKIYQISLNGVGVSIDDRKQIQFNIMNMVSHINKSGILVDGYVADVREKILFINSEITRLNNRNQMIILISGILVLGLFFFISTRQSTMLTIRIQNIDQSVNYLKNGDLRIRFDEKGKDELSKLSSNLNLFQRGLTDSLTNLKQVSSQNVSVQKDLDGQVKTAGEHTQSMDSRSQTIVGQMNELSSSIDESTESMGRLNVSVNSMNEQIIDQRAMVEESTASVTEMIASIENVTSITEKKTEAIGELVCLTKDGEILMTENTDAISGITASIDVISGIADIIKGIASQTNLLAMNAAIEAAHAGESGRGFSVVAEEIRKLAEAAGENSKIITRSIQEIIGNISSASNSNDKSLTMFSRISDEIDKFNSSLREISQTMGELKSGGTQILTAMNALMEVSQEIKNNSGMILNASSSQEALIEQINNASYSVTGSVHDIRERIEEINGILNKVMFLSESIGDSSLSMNEAISMYKTES